MWRGTYFRFRIVLIGLLLCLGYPSWGLVNVVNYDNHSALAKAKEYDLTMDLKKLYKPDGSFDMVLYDSYVARADRALAEKYYLEYLKDVNESFQRAAVCARLGEMFSGSVSHHVATTWDRSKARMYYGKALEAEPERIGWPTLQARGFFATDANSPEAQLESYMDYYEWLLSLDEKKLREKALPTRPPRTIPPAKKLDPMRKRFEEQMRTMPRPKTAGGGFLEFIKGQADVTAHNLVHRATGRMAYDPMTRMWSRDRAVKYLLVLAERFPGTSAAERAKAKLAETTAEIADDMLALFENELDDRWDLAFIPAVQHAVARGEPFFFDLKAGKLAPTPRHLHSEQAYTHLKKQGGDYLAWDGSLITLPDDQILAVRATSPGLVGENRRQWSISYGISEEMLFPYDLWFITEDGQKYLLRLAGVRPEGIHLFYRTVTDKEFKSGGEGTRKPDTTNDDGASESVPRDVE